MKHYNVSLVMHTTDGTSRVLKAFLDPDAALDFVEQAREELWLDIVPLEDALEG